MCCIFLHLCIYCNCGLCTLQESFIFLADPCSIGDIRLWGGESEYEGNIELCTNHGLWSAVSDSVWTNANAVVACRQLNYTGCKCVAIITHVHG